MRYRTVVPGRFLARPNRFIAQVEAEGAVQTVHVKNTGRCRELLVPGYTPNRVCAEWASGLLPPGAVLRREYVYGGSRLDFCVERPQEPPYLIEVKGVTLEEGGAARFPDAPTERGVKHIRELQKAAEAGLGAALFFVVQMEGMASVAPNDETHPAFGAALREAAAAGVRVCAWDCAVTPDSLEIRREVPVRL